MINVFKIQPHQIYIKHQESKRIRIRDSIVVSIPACHAGDRGSIPRLGVFLLL